MAEPSPRVSADIDPAIGAVEIKISARVEDEDKVLAALAKSGEEPQRRTVYFFDTPSLDLFDAGMVLRARKIKGDDDDSTVKLRPVVPSTIASSWIKTEGFEVEMDRVGENEVISAKLNAVQRPGEVDDAVGGKAGLRSLFSADQERLVAEFAPRDIEWDDLVPMGPIAVNKWKTDWDDFAHEVTVERWELPDGSDLVELSIKVEPGEVSSAYDDFLGGLAAAGLTVDDDQQTKTRGAFTFFTTGKGFDD
jgi:hypothetical protein